MILGNNCSNSQENLKDLKNGARHGMLKSLKTFVVCLLADFLIFSDKNWMIWC